MGCLDRDRSPLLNELPTGTVSLVEVRQFCADIRHLDEACFWVVVAWGGMRTNHARQAWDSCALWKPILRDLRSGCLTQRSMIYDRFLQASIPGLATAYFTKLMYFMSMGKRCYVLDQWTVAFRQYASARIRPDDSSLLQLLWCVGEPPEPRRDLRSVLRPG